MNRQEKRNYIKNYLDLSGCRLQEYEIDTIYEIVTHPQIYNGMTRERKFSEKDYSSDGYYVRYHEYYYRLYVDVIHTRTYIEKIYRFHDDDGTVGDSTEVYNDGRNYINLYNRYFRQRERY